MWPVNTVSTMQNVAQDILAKMRRPRPAAVTGRIGLHVSNAAVHAVQLHRGVDGKLTLRGSASAEFEGHPRELLDDKTRFALLVRRLYKSAGVRGRKTYSVLSASDVRMLAVTYTPSRRQSDDQTIARLMQERLDSPLSDYVIDYLPVRTAAGDGDRQALVAVAKREDAIRYLEALRACRLDVEALEAGPVAIRRLMAAVGTPDDKSSSLVINFGAKASYISMMSGRRLLFDQEVEFGSNALVDSVAGALDMSEDLALRLILKTGLHGEIRSDESDDTQVLREIVRPEVTRLVADIRRAYLYAAAETHGNVLSRVYLMGSIARWPGAAELISDMADVPARIMPGPAELFPVDDNASIDEETGPDLAVATGLALRGLVDDD